MVEWEVIQERIMKNNYNMKLYTKEHMYTKTYLETTYMAPSTKMVKTKYAQKKVKPTPNDSSTKVSPSFYEHVD